MMRMSMESMGKWRKFFEGAEADICTLIERAILVAAFDCPHQFKERRDKIMEKLYTSTSHSQHQHKSWREVANEEIKSTGNVVTAAIAGTSTMQEMAETKMDANNCSKQNIAAENTRNGVLKMDGENHSDRERQCYKYKVFRIGPTPGRLKIVRQRHMSYEENLHDKLDFKPSSLPSQHKLNSPDEKSVEEKIEASKKRLREGYQRAEKNLHDKLDSKPNCSLPFQTKLKSTDDKSVKEKIEASKKRLQEGYQRAEKAKKQRTVQLIELQDVPSFKSIRPTQMRA
ncbi:probable mediator of RNA polymerase II transcription subunit 26a isoform X2 [Cryptomeria japonica]|uniref:probable mediator of RNA polymerase II transcription subunit 26a isoform X2 n=1 Tax=Cryptomeria japonica TaxID=3369 RepID=UPI0025ACEA5E|nr:probable mediator of RNA polymerase II transcription subunit 26a isoform X2 [Cryptomeria japonica]